MRLLQAILMALGLMLVIVWAAGNIPAQAQSAPTVNHSQFPMGGGYCYHVFWLAYPTSAIAVETGPCTR